VGFEVSSGRRGVPVRIAAAAAGEGAIDVSIDAVVCSHEAAACWPVEARYRMPITVGDGGPVLDATARLPAPAH
jgi:hypothetical protein